MTRQTSRLCCVGLITAAAWSSADVVHMMDGQTLPGMVMSATDDRLVVLTLLGGTITVPAAKVARVESEPAAMYYVRQGDFHLERGNENEAERSYLRGLNVDGDFATARERVDTLRAERVMRQIRAEISLAEQLMERREFTEAIAAYGRALAISPSEEMTRDLNWNIAVAYARLAYDLHDHCYDQGARVELQRATQYSANCAEIHYVLGRIYHGSFDADNARREYELALNLDPSHVPSRSQLLRLDNELRAMPWMFRQSTSSR